MTEELRLGTKEIWLGPVHSGNRERLVDRCISVLNGGDADRFVYLSASRPLLERVTSALLDGEDRKGFWGRLPVYLFRGLVDRINSEAVSSTTGLPLPIKTTIDEDEHPLKTGIVSMLVKQLAADGKLLSLNLLARHDGCAATVEKLLGEIQRAGITASEFERIVNSREDDLGDPSTFDELREAGRFGRQTDFDRDISRIYSAYEDRLERFQLTEKDADQLRALALLRGDIGGEEIEVPWLSKLELLVIDGFYDFTPVQGAILRLLIPRIPNVIVYLNSDERNPEIFSPFVETIGTLQSISPFEVRTTNDPAPVSEELEVLRSRLFNSTLEPSSTDGAGADSTNTVSAGSVRVMQCSDPVAEIRFVAKEIKRLVLQENFLLSEISIVFRQCSDYAELIDRIFSQEGIPCHQQSAVRAVDIPSARAILKLLNLVDELAVGLAEGVKMGTLVSVFKSGYLKLPEVAALQCEVITTSNTETKSVQGLLFPVETKAANVTTVNAIDPDELENMIAFVGMDLTIGEWLKRGERLSALRRRAAPSISEEVEADDEAMEDNVANDPEAVLSVSPGKARSVVEPGLLEQAVSVVKRTLLLLAELASHGSPQSLADAIAKLVERFGFFEQVNGPLQDELAGNEMNAALEDLRGLEAFGFALHGAVRSFEVVTGSSASDAQTITVSLRDFTRAVLSCLNGVSFDRPGRERNGVEVLSATDVRGLRFRALFIGGLVEGAFPQKARHDWIYPPEERQRLKKYGLTLEDTSPDTLLKEEHYFYQAACRATERLYLTRPSVTAEGTETVESYYINELRHAMAPRVVRTETFSTEATAGNLLDSSTPSELVLGLSILKQHDGSVVQGMDGFDGAFVDELSSWVLEQQYQTGESVRRISAGYERAGASFGAFDGRVTNPALVEMIRLRFGDSHVFSASQLGLYGACPFKFFAQRILRLEARQEAAADLSALDAGKMMHEILRLFFERHRETHFDFAGFPELQGELRQTADDVFDRYEAEVPPLNRNIWMLDREIRKLALDQFLLDEIRTQEKTAEMGVRPTYFELAFGSRNGGVDPASVASNLELKGTGVHEGDTILVQGRIDRVDRAEDGTLIAYDYKLSKGASRDDMSEGRDLQLAIYATALGKLLFPESEIAGGGYYVLRAAQGRRNQGLYRKSFSAYTGIGPAVGANLSDDEWYEMRDRMMDKIWAFRDNLREGRFDVSPTAPSQTCGNCDYSKLCRFDLHRMRNKGNGETGKGGSGEEGRIGRRG